MKNVNVFFRLGEDCLTVGIALDIIRSRCKLVFDAETRERVQANRRVVENIVHSKRIVYGINTGFGPLCTTLINEEDTRTLQLNLLLSHSVGVEIGRAHV